MADLAQRRLAAILAADIAGYSALMGANEARTVRDIKGHQAVVLPMIGGHGGRIIDTAGDGILAEFPSIVNAVECALAIQRLMAERNVSVPPTERMQFRIGLNIGDVMYDETRIYGDGINIAARLEGIAQPGDICISGKVYDEVHGKLEQAWQFLGEKELKNIVGVVRVYAPVRPGRGEAVVAPLGNAPVTGRAPVRRAGFLRRLFGGGSKAKTQIHASPAAPTVSQPIDVAPALVSTATPVMVHGQARAFCILMSEDEAETRAALSLVRSAVSGTLREHGGELIESPPDTIVAAFKEAPTGVAGAIAALEGLLRMNRDAPPTSRVHYRFGVVTDTAGDGASAETRSSAIALAAGLGFRAHTDGIVIGEGVRSRLTFGSAQRFVMTAPGAYAYSRDTAADAKWPTQLEGLELPVPNDRPSIANGPFLHIGNDPEGEAFAEGLRLDIQNNLLKMSGLFLLGAGAANALRDAPTVDRAKRIGVRYALEGTVRRSTERVRVDARLLDTKTDRIVWAEQYDRKIDETFRLEDEIAERIVTELDVKLVSGEQARIWRKGLSNPRARQHYYEGLQAFFRGNAEAMASARKSFERVTELALNSGHGPSFVAMCYWQDVTRGWAKDRNEAIQLAGYWAERGAKFEDADGNAITVLGNVRLLQSRFDEALKISRDAITQRPGCPNSNSFFANVLLHCGDPAAAIVHIKRAIRIVPLYSPWWVEILAAAYRDAGQPDLAVMAAREAVRISPQSLTARMILISALVRSGWVGDARRVAGEVVALDPKFSVASYLHAPYQDPTVLDRLREDFQRAGLPD